MFVTSSRFKEPIYSNQASCSLRVATHDTQELIIFALVLTEGLYRKGVLFSKAGVLLTDLISDTQIQPYLFDHKDRGTRERNARLMEVVDRLSTQMGRGTIWHGAEGIHQKWKTKTTNVSPCWTTRWNSLPLVKAW